MSRMLLFLLTASIGILLACSDRSPTSPETAKGNRLTITVTVPALQQAFGPFQLAAGVNNKWSPCMYPGRL